MTASHVATSQPDFASIDTRIRAFRGSSSRRFKSHIERLLPAIESAMADGSTRHELHELLVSEGMTITFEGFKSALYRLRKARRLAEVPKVATQSQPQDTTPQSPTPPVAAPRAGMPATSAPLVRSVAPRPPVPPRPPSTPIAAPGQAPRHGPGSPTALPTGSISEIARTDYDITAYREKGREYAAKLAREKAAEAPPPNSDTR